MHFPFSIDMSNYVKTQGVVQSNQNYELSAVLIHRGPSAYSGHYIGILHEQHCAKFYEISFFFFSLFCVIRQHILRIPFQELGTNLMTKLYRK